MTKGVLSVNTGEGGIAERFLYFATMFFCLAPFELIEFQNAIDIQALRIVSFIFSSFFLPLHLCPPAPFCNERTQPRGTDSLAEQERIMYQMPPRLRKLKNYTQDEILAMFEKCEKNAKGDMVFQSFAEYDRWICCVPLIPSPA